MEARGCTATRLMMDLQRTGPLENVQHQHPPCTKALRPPPRPLHPVISLKNEPLGVANDWFQLQ